MKTPPKNIAASLRNRYMTAIRRLRYGVENAEIAVEERLAHKGIHRREQLELVQEAIERFKQDVPFLFEDQQDVLSPGFDLVEAIENAVPVEDILAAGEKWQKENPKMLDVLRGLHLAGEIFGEDGAFDWIANSNPRLDGRSPSDVIEQDEGGLDKVCHLLTEIRNAMGHVPSLRRDDAPDEDEDEE